MPLFKIAFLHIFFLVAVSAGAVPVDDELQTDLSSNLPLSVLPSSHQQNFTEERSRVGQFIDHLLEGPPGLGELAKPLPENGATK